MAIDETKKAPERLTLYVGNGGPWYSAADLSAGAMVEFHGKPVGEYVRADIHQAVVAERDAKQRGLFDLSEALRAREFELGGDDVLTVASSRMRERDELLAERDELWNERDELRALALRLVRAANDNGGLPRQLEDACRKLGVLP